MTKIYKTEDMKKDTGKPRVNLVPKELILEVAKVLGFGADKYEADMWREGMKYSRLYAALQRHLLAWYHDKEALDPESGLPHLAHAASCIAFLLTYEETKTGIDDRFSYGEEE